MHSQVSWPWESCTVRYLGPGVMYSEVSWPWESYTVRHPGPGSHAHWGILPLGVMHSEASWPWESCTVRYPSPGSHAQWGILALVVMHSEASWSEVLRCCTVQRLINWLSLYYIVCPGCPTVILIRFLCSHNPYCMSWVTLYYQYPTIL